MKCSYNLGQFDTTFKLKDEFEGNISVSQSKVEIEFNLEEMGAVLGNALEMRRLFIEGVERITPVIKDTLMELGTRFSEEVQKNEIASAERHNKYTEEERKTEELRHQHRMEEIAAQK